MREGRPQDARDPDCRVLQAPLPGRRLPMGLVAISGRAPRTRGGRRDGSCTRSWRSAREPLRLSGDGHRTVREEARGPPLRRAASSGRAASQLHQVRGRRPRLPRPAGQCGGGAQRGGRARAPRGSAARPPHGSPRPVVHARTGTHACLFHDPGRLRLRAAVGCGFSCRRPLAGSAGSPASLAPGPDPERPSPIPALAPEPDVWAGRGRAVNSPLPGRSGQHKTRSVHVQAGASRF